MVAAIVRDLRFAGRGLRRAPGFSAAAILTIAIGATAHRVIGSVMRQAMLTVLVGVAIGLAGAFWSARFLEALLFGVRPNDPATLASVAALFLAVAMLAAYVPARRATRVDPVTALRAE